MLNTKVHVKSIFPLFLFCLFVAFWGVCFFATVWLCIWGWPGICHTAKAEVQLPILLCQPLSCWNYKTVFIPSVQFISVGNSKVLTLKGLWTKWVCAVFALQMGKKNRPGPGISPPQLAAELDKRGDLQVKSIWNEILTLVIAKTVCSIPFCFKPILHNAVNTGVLGFWVVVSPFVQECGRGLVWAYSS